MSFMQRQRNFWNEMIWKPKKLLSLEQLKYHHATLERNPTVTEANKKLLVETFRSIAEILIWGDQNDSCVFDFFLEKNMQSRFLKILSQQPGRYVVLQLLQTMSILFENIKNETSIYYLLSNNHVNSIIMLKLDFSDEEVLAYYISFLKTLSFKLNKHTIHFFYNEHLRDFPLYTEAIKFFNHPESMVRIAVRTLTLNVYKVEDKNTIDFICNKTAAPYFSNLVWFIGNHVLQLDECLQQNSDHLNRNSLESAVAEHLDHLHYLGDILSLNVASLNDVLRDHLLNRLFIPLYVYSLFEMSVEVRKDEETPRVSSNIALFLLSQVFLIISHPLLTTELAYLILTGDHSMTFPPSLLEDSQNGRISPSPLRHRRNSSKGSIRGFVPPEESLTDSLTRPIRARASPKPAQRLSDADIGGDFATGTNGGKGGSSSESHSYVNELDAIPEYNGFIVIESPSERELAEALARQQLEKQGESSEDEGEVTVSNEEQSFVGSTVIHSIPIKSSVFLESVLSAIIPAPNDDSRCLFAISLFYAMLHNEGINPRLLEAFSLKHHKYQKVPYHIQTELIGRLLSVIEASAVGSVRLVTLHLCITLLSDLLHLDFSYTADKSNSLCTPPPSDTPPFSLLSEHHQKKVERAVEGASRQLEKFYRTLGESEMLIDMFEDEYSNEKKFYLKVNYLLMDAAMLLPPAGTPLTGIDFTKRLPCGETEKARKSMRVFFAIRNLHQKLKCEEEKHLPLTPVTTSVVTEDIVDTTNCDLVRCAVVIGDTSVERFLMVTDSEFILVNPDKSKLGCGIVKFIAFLQDVEISPDPADNLSLFVLAHQRSRSQIKRRPALQAKMTFEDNIRCLATRQNLQRKKELLRHSKMSIIAEMLGIPPPSSPIRKRNLTPPPVPAAEVTRPVDIPKSDTNQTPLKFSPEQSPKYMHKIATKLFKTSPTVEDPASETYELGMVDSNGLPVSSRVPSPHALYVPNTEKVLLSLGNDPFESKVRIIPQKPTLKGKELTCGDEVDMGGMNRLIGEEANNEEGGTQQKNEVSVGIKKEYSEKEEEKVEQLETKAQVQVIPPTGPPDITSSSSAENELNSKPHDNTPTDSSDGALNVVSDKLVTDNEKQATAALNGDVRGMEETDVKDMATFKYKQVTNDAENAVTVKQSKKESVNEQSEVLEEHEGLTNVKEEKEALIEAEEILDNQFEKNRAEHQAVIISEMHSPDIGEQSRSEDEPSLVLVNDISERISTFD